jgi:NAD(P)-dependent dehydrogenase (short-subunit alcohol dehydrogenase family)
VSGSGASGPPALAGQTVVVTGGSSGIGVETARRARLGGAAVHERNGGAPADSGPLIAAFTAAMPALTQALALDGSQPLVGG